MRLRGIEFEPCWGAAGLDGFFGEGYWFHHIPIIHNKWFDFTGTTRVTKTTTLFPRIGNMPVTRQYQPTEWFPRCIWWSWWRAIALNSVALSGPGAFHLIEDGLLDRDSAPYMISFMSVLPETEDRLEEFATFVKLLKPRITDEMRKIVGLQINVSCPNTGLDPSTLISEVSKMLDLAEVLDIPIMIKLNVLAPPDVVKSIAQHPQCDALCATNTIPFEKLPDRIPWQTLFPKGSPLKKRDRAFGGGGLSGEPLRPLVIEWVNRIRDAGVNIPLNIGGGILHPDHVQEVVEKAGLRRGIDSIFIGSIAMLRPWRIRSVIIEAHLLLSHKYGTHEELLPQLADADTQ